MPLRAWIYRKYPDISKFDAFLPKRLPIEDTSGELYRDFQIPPETVDSTWSFHKLGHSVNVEDTILAGRSVASPKAPIMS